MGPAVVNKAANVVLLELDSLDLVAFLGSIVYGAARPGITALRWDLNCRLLFCEVRRTWLPARKEVECVSCVVGRAPLRALHTFLAYLG